MPQDYIDPFAQEVTEERRRDIRDRLWKDIAKDNPMMGSGTLETIVDHAMFYIEHLLAELEVKR